MQYESMVSRYPGTEKNLVFDALGHGLFRRPATSDRKAPRMAGMPPPPAGSQKQGDEIPDSWIANWQSLSGPERLWYSLRGRSVFVQALLWLLFYPFLIGLWLVKNLTSQSTSTGLKIVSGAVVLLFIVGLFS